MPTPYEWKKIREEKQQRIDKAISQRDKSIAYFNSVNSAISLFGEIMGEPNTIIKAEDLQKEIKYWRDWFYSQWQEWYIESMPSLHWTEKTPKKAINSEIENEQAGEENFKTKEQQEKIEKVNLELTE